MNTEQTSMANGKGSKELREWQKGWLELADVVKRNTLDPIMTFAELMRGYDQDKGIDFNLGEISEVLRLLVIGGRQT